MRDRITRYFIIWKEQDRVTRLLRVARAVVGVAFLAAAGLLGYHLREYWRGDRIYEQIRQAALTEQTQEAADGAAQEEAPVEREIDFDALCALNPDCVAWISACDGEIEYPVVVSEDDTWYLTHTIDGEANKAGSIFVDRYVEAPFMQFQTILYGHNMKNGSMFHALLYYRDSGYWEEHPTVTVYLEDGSKTYRVFSAYYADWADLEVYDSLETDKEREAYLDRIIARSLYETGVPVAAADEILTLITCEYSGEDYRMVVHAVAE